MGEGIGLGFAGKPVVPEWVGGAGSFEARRGGKAKRYSFTGPLGIGEFGATARAEEAAFKAVGPAGRARVTKSIGKAAAANIGKVKFGAGAALGTALRALGPVMVGYAMYTGYQKEGTWGAIKGGVEELAIWGALEAGMYMLGGPVIAGAAGITAAGVGYYAYGTAAQAHKKRMRNVEMGGQLFDPYGMNATTRQRSLQALHNSHINGRMAIGSEAVLLHR
jgi:hypothetical protein